MKAVNYIEVSSVMEEDINKGKTTWVNGKCVSLDEGSAMTFFLGHKEETVYGENLNTGMQEERKVMVAFPVRVTKPVTRDMAINAAEMEAYNLHTSMEVASFNASLARKSRVNAEDEEVLEHDRFIAWVKEELTKAGVS